MRGVWEITRYVDVPSTNLPSRDAREKMMGVEGTYGYELECYLKGLPATVCCADELPTQAAAVVAAAVDIHDCLYVYIGDGGGPARSSSIRTRATVAEVTGWRFTFSSWDPPNFSICWKTHRKRIIAVSPTSWLSTDRNNTTVRLKSNPMTPTPAGCIACTTLNKGIEEWSSRTSRETFPPLI